MMTIEIESLVFWLLGAFILGGVVGHILLPPKITAADVRRARLE
jgi:hypothetical protein